MNVIGNKYPGTNNFILSFPLFPLMNVSKPQMIQFSLDTCSRGSELLWSNKEQHICQEVFQNSSHDLQRSNPLWSAALLVEVMFDKWCRRSGLMNPRHFTPPLDLEVPGVCLLLAAGVFYPPFPSAWLACIFALMHFLRASWFMITV